MTPSALATRLAGALCILCAFTLQIQVTLFASESYLGLRINLTDLLTPFAGLAILFTLLRKESRWPDWNLPHFYAWLGLLTFILGAALLNGWYNYGEISQWALVNKFLGWFILLAIMGLGAWVGTNATQAQITLFTRLFLGFFLIVLGIDIAVFIYNTLITHEGPYTAKPLAGLMANRNAYAFLFVAAFIVSTRLYFSDIPFLKNSVAYLLFFLLPVFMLFNASRAAWFILVVLVILFAVLYRAQARKVLQMVLLIAIGSMITAAFFSKKSEEIYFIAPRMTEVLTGDIETHGGDKMRKTIINMAFPQARERPVLGSGLGAAMMEQEKQTGNIINLIDNTGLWLVVETGIVGTVLFCGFYLVIVQNLTGRLKEDDPLPKALRVSMLYLILAFTIMCLLHELMYTRFLWFFLGLAIALPARMRQDG